jgi:hypothetical protein
MLKKAAKEKKPTKPDKPAKNPPNPVGRPPIVIDFSKGSELYNAALAQGTIPEIEAITGNDFELLNQKCLKQLGQKFSVWMNNRKKEGQFILRSKAFSDAMEGGALRPAQAIFLQKNYLGMTDRYVETLTLKGKIHLVSSLPALNKAAKEDTGDDDDDTQAGEP